MLDLSWHDPARLVAVVNTLAASVKRKPVCFAMAPRPSDRRWRVAVYVPPIPAILRGAFPDEPALRKAFPEVQVVDDGLDRMIG